MTKDSTSTLLRSMKHFFSGTMISRLAGLLRDISMAFAFGTQESVAAFLMAFRFAHLLRRLFGEGAMQSAFVPIFEKLRSASSGQAARFFLDLVATLITILSVIIIVGTVGCGLCLSFDLVSEGNREVLTYTMIMLPSLLFICLFGLNTSLLQCAHQFFIPSIAPVVFNLIWIAAAILLAGSQPYQGMLWLSACIIIACAGQWAVTLPATIRTLKTVDPKALRHKWKVLAPDIKLLIPPLLMAIIGVSASQINNALDVIFARYADPQGPAYLWYAIRLQQLPLALFGIAISGALLPPLTRALKTNDILRFRHYLSFALRRSIALMLPMTAGIFLLGGMSIQLLYGHGDFNNESVYGTTLCLLGYGAGLLPMTLVLVLAPAFYSQENFRLPTIASLASMGVNIALNSWFIMGLQFGASSVAWSTSFSSLINLIILAYALRTHMTSVFTFDFFVSCMKIAASTAVATAGCVILPFVLSEAPLIQISVQSTLFGILFFSSAYFFKAQDVFFDTKKLLLPNS